LLGDKADFGKPFSFVAAPPGKASPLHNWLIYELQPARFVSLLQEARLRSKSTAYETNVFVLYENCQEQGKMDSLSVASLIFCKINQAAIFLRKSSGKATSLLGAHGEIFNTDAAGDDFNIIQLSTPTTPIPEPASLILFGFGLIGLVGVRRMAAK
jgi:hypothetical protein